jgi:hypothetical protein
MAEEDAEPPVREVSPSPSLIHKACPRPQHTAGLWISYNSLSGIDTPTAVGRMGHGSWRANPPSGERQA